MGSELVTPRVWQGHGCSLSVADRLLPQTPSEKRACGLTDQGRPGFIQGAFTPDSLWPQGTPGAREFLKSSPPS